MLGGCRLQRNWCVRGSPRYRSGNDSILKDLNLMAVFEHMNVQGFLVENHIHNMSWHLTMVDLKHDGTCPDP